MKRKILYLLLLLLPAGMASAQSFSAYVEAGEKAFESKNYHSALDYYLNAQEFDTTRLDIAYKVAESARMFNSYSYAEANYAYVLQEDSNNEFPLASFRLAQILQKQGNVTEAKQYYEIYITEHPEHDPYFTAVAEKEITASDWAIERLEQPDERYDIEVLGNHINTEYSEFAALDKDDKLYFSSLRYETKADKNEQQRLSAKVLTVESDSTIIEFDALNNGHKSVAHATYNNDGSRIYYTVCDYDESTVDIMCDLYYREIGDNGDLGSPMKLPSTINKMGYTATQPAIAFDDETNQELLYFVSDRDGGKGKLDIWYTKIEKGSGFTEPINVESINTPENDITPFYHRVSKSLYFSSEGYRSIGGYDIYKAKRIDDQYDAAEHLPTSLNSSYDDIYFTLDNSEEHAYFSSNRKASQYLDSDLEACCFDIYKVNIKEVFITLDAETFSSLDNSELDGVKVTVQDAVTGEILQELYMDTSHHHVFELPKGKEILIIGEKYPYESDTLRINTNLLPTGELITKKLYLDLNEVPTSISVFDERTLTQLDGAEIRIIDLSDNSTQDLVLRADGGVAKFNLPPGKKFKIVVSKPGYETSSIIVDTANPGSGEINKKIYLKKKDLNIFLPLTLYFDNDRPNRKTLAVTTQKTYTDTYLPYMNRKDLFVRKTGLTLAGDQRRREEQRMIDFFEFDVRVGYDKMNNFLEGIYKNLQSGNEFEIEIKGFTSPLASNEYNINLGKRRVSSVRNELLKFQNGILRTYLDSGKLKITDISFGEALSPSFVSDSRTLYNKSIYSVEASLERRVEIIKVNSLYSYNYK